MWTIKNKGRYVKDSHYSGIDDKSSFTRNPNYAVKYPTQEEAQKNACGNEQVVRMSLEWV